MLPFPPVHTSDLRVAADVFKKKQGKLTGKRLDKQRFVTIFEHSVVKFQHAQKRTTQCREQNACLILNCLLLENADHISTSSLLWACVKWVANHTKTDRNNANSLSPSATEGSLMHLSEHFFMWDVSVIPRVSFTTRSNQVAQLLVLLQYLNKMKGYRGCS